jgi:prepilin-type N-terminal cleavage/methylation domain-containing protein
MMLVDDKKRQRGFTLIELLTALGIFLLITGAAFTLLSSSQQRYQTESQLLTAFQEARLGLDQMVRDINDAGFPPPTFVNGSSTKVTSTPFAWSAGAGYSTNPPPPPNPCQIGTAGSGTCTTATDFAPGDFDLIIETEPNPLDPACSPNCPVQWIRYQLGGPNGTTLMRGVANKAPNADPDGSTSGVLVPFVQNVVNNVCPQQLPNCHSAYPIVFSGGKPVPIFQYTCDHPSVPQFPAPPTAPCPSPSTGSDNSPQNIRDILITLIVAAPLPDATTGQPRLVQLEGRGRRINPNQ